MEAAEVGDRWWLFARATGQKYVWISGGRQSAGGGPTSWPDGAFLTPPLQGGWMRSLAQTALRKNQQQGMRDKRSLSVVRIFLKFEFVTQTLW